MGDFDKMLEDIKKREIEMGIQISLLQANMACTQADLAYIKAELKDCVNELCLCCGSYKKSHEGACDDCRWKVVKEGLR